MTNDDGRKPEGARERSSKAGVGALRVSRGMAPSAFLFSARWRLLRGEPLELEARETDVSIARLGDWRERALAGAARRGGLDNDAFSR